MVLNAVKGHKYELHDRKEKDVALGAWGCRWDDFISAYEDDLNTFWEGALTLKHEESMQPCVIFILPNGKYREFRFGSMLLVQTIPFPI
jgi:hypothetical protein